MTETTTLGTQGETGEHLTTLMIRNLPVETRDFMRQTKGIAGCGTVCGGSVSARNS